MMTSKLSVDLTRQELSVIRAALETQEKILSVQSRASTDTSARSRLQELREVLGALQRQTPLPERADDSSKASGLSSMARALFC